MSDDRPCTNSASGKLEEGHRLCQRHRRRGRTVCVGGQIGWNGDQVFEANDLVGQTRQALENIVAVLAEAGARPGASSCGMTWYVTDKQDYLANLKEIGAAYRAVMGGTFRR